MIRIEANTLEEAYLNAASELGCSITELDIEIVQNANSGFLGMFKKTAIIEVVKKGFHRKETKKKAKILKSILLEKKKR